MSRLINAFRESNSDRDSIYNFIISGTDNEVHDISNQTVITVQPFGRDQPSWRCPLPIISGSHESSTQNILPISGIQILSDIEQLEICQTIDLEDLYTYVQSENKYLVKEETGNLIFTATEGSAIWQRLFCCSSRRFILVLHDKTRQEALLLIRRLAPKNPILSCYLQRMDVFAPQSEYIGCIQQKWDPTAIHLTIRNHENEDIFHLSGPLCSACASYRLIEFHVFSYDTPQSVCTITHKWDEHKAAYNLNVIFLEYLNSTKKALILGCAFLLEYIYFQAACS